MHTKLGKVWFWLAFFLMNSLSPFAAAPQQGQSLDLGLGIFKVSLDTEDGLLLRKEFNIDIPFFTLRQKAEVGFGRPIVPATDSKEESVEDQSSRLKRELSDDKSTQDGNLVRRKRTPCHGGATAAPAPAPAPGDGNGVDEEARRRIARRIQRARKTRGRKTNSKRNGRRRRQAEIENFNINAQVQNVGKNFGEQVDQAVLKARRLWESMMQTSVQFVESVKNAFNSSTNGVANALAS